MPKRPEAPRVKPKDVYALSNRRLAAARLAGRQILKSSLSDKAPGSSVLEFMPPEPAAFDFFFNSIVWQHIDNYFNSKGLGHHYAKKYRRMEMGREKRNAEAAALSFVNRHVETLEQQRDTTGILRGRRIAAETLDTRIEARAVMSEEAPAKTYWAVQITNRQDVDSAFSLLTTNTESVSVGDVDRERHQRRVFEMAMIDPATIASWTLEPYAPPQDVINRTAFYQTVETAFAMLGIAASTGQFNSYPDVPIVPPNSQKFK